MKTPNALLLSVKHCASVGRSSQHVSDVYRVCVCVCPVCVWLLMWLTDHEDQQHLKAFRHVSRRDVKEVVLLEALKQ